jgi:hypothetical protein
LKLAQQGPSIKSYAGRLFLATGWSGAPLLMTQQGGFQHRQLFVGLQAAEGFLGLRHRGSQSTATPSAHRANV